MICKEVLTGVLWVDVPVPRNGRINERSRRVGVKEQRKVNGDFGSSSRSDVRRECAKSEMNKIHDDGAERTGILHARWSLLPEGKSCDLKQHPQGHGAAPRTCPGHQGGEMK